MKIITYITHSIVEPWHFKPEHAAIIKKELPDAEIVICESED